MGEESLSCFGVLWSHCILIFIMHRVPKIRESGKLLFLLYPLHCCFYIFLQRGEKEENIQRVQIIVVLIYNAAFIYHQRFYSKYKLSTASVPPLHREPASL